MKIYESQVCATSQCTAVREAKVLHASILCNGDETQKSWKPLLNTIFALSGSSEWFAQLEVCRTFASLPASPFSSSTNRPIRQLPHYTFPHEKNQSNT